MNKFNDVDLTRGYQKYDAMVKNIEGIFNNGLRHGQISKHI